MGIAIVDMEKLPSEPAPVYIKAGILDFYSQLEKINEATPEGQIYDLLSRAYPNLLSEEYVKKQRPLVRKLFTQDKVLLMMGKVMKNAADGNTITHDQRVYMNKIIYSMIKNNAMKSEYQTSLLMNISRHANRMAVQKLISCVPEQVACTIAVLRYSSFKEGTNVLRVNDYLLKVIAPNEKAEQTIVNIYDALFQRVTYLFEGIMLDVKDKEMLSENEREVYGIQSLAVLDIIENMPQNYIYQVLKAYYSDLSLIYTSMPTRFSLSSIAVSDYPRITSVDRQLSAQASYMA